MFAYKYNLPVIQSSPCKCNNENITGDSHADNYSHINGYSSANDSFHTDGYFHAGYSHVQGHNIVEENEMPDGHISRTSSIEKVSSVDEHDMSSRSSSTDLNIKSAKFTKPSPLKQSSKLKKRHTKTRAHVISETVEEEILTKLDEDHCIRFLCEHESVRAIIYPNIWLINLQNLS